LLANGRSGWSDVRLVEGVKEETAGVTVVAPDGVNPEFSEPPAGIHVPGSLGVFLDKGKAVSAGQSLLEMPFDCATESSGIALPAGADTAGKIVSATVSSTASEKALRANPPNHGRLILTWLVRLPESASSLNLKAGIADDSNSEGVGFEVRVNGETAWSYRSKESRWESASADLSHWKGKIVLLQLVTDSLGGNEGDNAVWSDIILTSKQ
jgi:hypothetical protein